MTHYYVSYYAECGTTGSDQEDIPLTAKTDRGALRQARKILSNRTQYGIPSDASVWIMWHRDSDDCTGTLTF